MITPIRETVAIDRTITVSGGTREKVFESATINAGAGEAIYVDRVVTGVVVEAVSAAFNGTDFAAVTRVQTGGVSASTSDGFASSRAIDKESTNGGTLGQDETNRTGIVSDIGEYVQDGDSIAAEVGANLLNNDSTVDVEVSGEAALIARQVV